MTKIKYSEVEVGFELPKFSQNFKRENLNAYAKASGDFNKIHLDEEFAKSVGLPNIIAHGMLTMGIAGKVVTNWLADPNAIKSFSVKFSSPVVVPDDGVGIDVEFTGRIGEKMDDNKVKIELEARCLGTKVLGRSLVIAQLA